MAAFLQGVVWNPLLPRLAARTRESAEPRGRLGGPRVGQLLREIPRLDIREGVRARSLWAGVPLEVGLLGAYSTRQDKHVRIL